LRKEGRLPHGGGVGRPGWPAEGATAAVAPHPGEGAFLVDGATPRDGADLDVPLGGGGVLRPPGARGRWWDAGYLDLLHLLAPADAQLIKRCGLVWYRETHPTLGERRRVVGCGERVLCPRCATAVSRYEAGEAVSLLEGLVGSLGEFECWGVGWTFTMPKRFSEVVEEALLGDSERFRRLMNALFEGVRCVLKRLHERDGEIAGVVVLHLQGDESLVEPHFHLHCYVFPYARRGDGGWGVVKRWADGEILAMARRLWKSVLVKVFGAFDGEVDVHRLYFKSRGQAVHYLAYQLRPPLEGLWDGGWRQVSVEGAKRILNRVRALPRGFKRVRWLGWLTPGQRRKVLPGLGFREAEDEDGGGRWQRVGGGVLLGWRRREDGGWEGVFKDWDGVVRTCSEEKMEWWPPWGGRRRRWVWGGGEGGGDGKAV